MSHENSETVQKGDKWINVYGEGLPKAGQQLPDSEEYLSVDAAVEAAKKRSSEHKGSADAFLSETSAADFLEVKEEAPAKEQVSAAEFLNKPDREDVPSTWAQVKYGADKGVGGMIKDLSTWLYANYPSAGEQLYVDSSGIRHRSAEERYGEDWYTISTEERRQRLLDIEDKKLKEDHPDVAGTPYANSGWSKVADVASSLVTDPTTYIPLGVVGKGVQFGKSLLTKEAAKDIGKLVAAGGAVASTGELLRQAARENDMNYGDVGIAGMVGAVLTPLVAVPLIKGIGYISSKSDKAMTNHASQIIDSFQTKVTQEIAQGTNRPAAMAKVMAETGVNGKQLNEIMERAGKGIFLPKTPKHAAELLADPEPIGIRPWKSGSMLDYMIEPVLTRIKKIDDAFWLRMQKFEMNIHSKPHELISEAKSTLFDSARKLSKDNQALFHKAWQNQDHDTLARLFKGDEAALSGLKGVRAVYDDFLPKLKEVYPDMKSISGYLSRHIKDLEGLKKAMGSKLVQGYDKQVLEMQQKLKRSLTEIEKSDLMNTFLRGNQRQGSALGASKSRVFQQVPDEFLPFYATPEESFNIYVRRAVQTIEKHQLFHRYTKRADGFNEIDSEKSIGELIKHSNMDWKKAEELKKLLHSRFVIGEQSPSNAVQLMRDFGYMGTLTDWSSSLTQLTENAITMVKHGLWNTSKAIMRTPRIRADVDLGLATATAELGDSTMRSALALDWMLKNINRFKQIDRFAKTVDANAALYKWESKVQTKKGLAELTSKYEQAYGDDFALLVDDLRNKRITPQTKLLSWVELERTQPNAKSSMPQAWLDHPNGRLMGQLLSFTLKQINFVRDEIFREQFGKGHWVEGSKQLARVAVYVSAAGVGKKSLENWILQRDMTWEDMPEMALAAFWRNYGGSEQAVHNILHAEKPKNIADVGIRTLEGIGDMGVPILDIAANLGKDAVKLAQEEDYYSDKVTNYPSLRNIVPGAGKMIHNYFGGGLEAYRKRKEKEKENKSGYDY